MLEERITNLQNNKLVVLETKKQQWREDYNRNKKLKELDLQFIIALEKLVDSLPGDTSELKTIISLKNELRNVTDIDLSAFKDEFELMDYVPDIIK
jgi:hypothetical protein